MNTFQVGQGYSTRLIGDSSLMVYATVIGRSKSTVTVVMDGEVVRRKVYEFMGEENFASARHSKAPIFSASDMVKDHATI